jgi:hypothetical protein
MTPLLLLAVAAASSTQAQCRQVHHFADGQVETTMIDDDGSIGSSASGSTHGGTNAHAGTPSSHSTVSASSSTSGSGNAHATSSSSTTVNGVTRSVRVTRDESGCTVTIDERDQQE